MLVCGRCRGDGTRRLLWMRRPCAACGGSGVIAPDAGGFGSLAVARPDPPRSGEPYTDGFAYGPIDADHACDATSDCSLDPAGGCEPGGDGGGGDGGSE
jgi:hypothetical protein